MPRSCIDRLEVCRCKGASHWLLVAVVVKGLVGENLIGRVVRNEAGQVRLLRVRHVHTSWALGTEEIVGNFGFIVDLGWTDGLGSKLTSELGDNAFAEWTGVVQLEPFFDASIAECVAAVDNTWFRDLFNTNRTAHPILLHTNTTGACGFNTKF